MLGWKCRDFSFVPPPLFLSAIFAANSSQCGVHLLVSGAVVPLPQ